jgi:hypothetical protein
MQIRNQSPFSSQNPLFNKPAHQNANHSVANGNQTVPHQQADVFFGKKSKKEKDEFHNQKIKNFNDRRAKATATVATLKDKMPPKNDTYYGTTPITDFNQNEPYALIVTGFSDAATLAKVKDIYDGKYERIKQEKGSDSPECKKAKRDVDYFRYREECYEDPGKIGNYYEDPISKKRVEFPTSAALITPQLSPSRNGGYVLKVPKDRVLGTNHQGKGFPNTGTKDEIDKTLKNIFVYRESPEVIKSALMMAKVSRTNQTELILGENEKTNPDTQVEPIGVYSLVDCDTGKPIDENQHQELIKKAKDLGLQFIEIPNNKPVNRVITRKSGKDAQLSVDLDGKSYSLTGCYKPFTYRVGRMPEKPMTKEDLDVVCTELKKKNMSKERIEAIQYAFNTRWVLLKQP